MRTPEPIAEPTLMEEIGRYLAVVELFRSMGHEPSWRPEGAETVSPERFSCERREHRAVH